MTDYVSEVRDANTGGVFLQRSHGAVVDGLFHVVDLTRPLGVIERYVVSCTVVDCQTATKGHQVVKRVLGQTLRTHVRLLQMRKLRVLTVKDCTVPGIDGGFTLHL
ncbi:hypothetical protein D3C71_1241760 [compost metagenome]